MFKKTFVAAAFAACLPVSTALAEEPWQDPVAQQFFECSAVYDAAAFLMAASSRPEQAKLLRQMANGAEVAGAFMMYAASADEGAKPMSIKMALHIAQAQRDTRGTNLKATLEANPGYEIEPQLTACVDLAPMQELIVNEARAWMYSAE